MRLWLCVPAGGVVLSLAASFKVFGFLKLRNERKHLARIDDLRAHIAEEERRTGERPASPAWDLQHAPMRASGFDGIGSRSRLESQMRLPSSSCGLTSLLGDVEALRRPSSEA